MTSLKGKVAVVTGAASGIGRAICIALAKEGSNIIVADILDKEGQQTVKLIEEVNGKAFFVHCNVTSLQDLANTLKVACTKFGRIDIFCNNAGILEKHMMFQNTENVETSFQHWKSVVDVNFTAVVLGTQLAIKEMRKCGNGGVIINTASMGGLIPIPGNPVYSATKAGVIHFTRCLADLSDEGIRVNVICPSYTNTSLAHQDGPQVVEVMKQSMGGRILTVEEVAEGVLQLCKDKTKAGAIMRVTVQKGIDYSKPPYSSAKL